MKSATIIITAADGPAGEPAVITTSIQQAVDTAHATGGGTVVLGPGRHCCGSIELKSGVELHLAHGCRLVAAEDPELFPPLAGHDPKLTANKAFGALLQARGVRDVALTGSGTIDGGGGWEQAPDWLSAQAMFRPAIGYFQDCDGLHIEGLRFVGAKWWCLHLRRCQRVRVSGVSMRHNWPNSDGIDPDGCQDVIISDCHLVCGDDCIVAKSTQGDDCENLLVSNCLLETPCACFKLGTESLGTFRNISISNCVMRGNVCFALYMKDGGCMENIQAANLLMEGDADYPIFIDSMPRDYRSGLPAGTIRNVRLSQVMVRGPGRAWIEGADDGAVENIRIADIDWWVSGPLRHPRAPKPLGSARVVTDPARPAHEQSDFQVIAVNVRNLRLENWSLGGPAAAGRKLPG